MNVAVTIHAAERAEERLGLTREGVEEELRQCAMAGRDLSALAGLEKFSIRNGNGTLFVCSYDEEHDTLWLITVKD